MINNFKKYYKIILIILGIIGIYFFLRLYHLTSFPIFADEAIYVRWSQVMKSEPTLRFISMQDGKQPLFMWLLMPFLKIFTDPLFAGRFLSVLAGLAIIIGIFLLTWQLFKSIKFSLLSIFIYSILSYTVFFDRMALVDSLLSMFGVYVLTGAIILLKNNRYDLAMVLGFILGGALLTKSPAIFFVLLLPTTFILLYQGKIKESAIKFIKIIPFWLITYFLGYAIYNILRLGPNFQMLGARNKDYVFSFSEVLSHPLDPFKPHIMQVVEWFIAFTGWPLIVLFILGIIIGLKKYTKETILLALWFFIPVLSQMSIAKVFTARYILFTIPYFIILSVIGLNYILEKISSFKMVILNKNILAIIFVAVIISPNIINNYYLLTNPQKADLTGGERSGYLEEWSSGYGIPEVRDYINKLPKDKHIIIGTEGYFGTLPDGLQIYFDKDPRVTLVGVGLDLNTVPDPLLESVSKGSPTYLVINDSRMMAQKDPRLKLIFSTPKAVNKKGIRDSLLFYQVIKL